MSRKYFLIMSLLAVVIFSGVVTYTNKPTSITTEHYTESVPTLSKELPQESSGQSPKNKQSSTANEAIETHATSSPSATEELVQDILDTPVTESIVYTIPVTSSSTALAAMETYAVSNQHFSFSGRDFPGLGLFLEEIGGKKNKDGYYWTLFINGKLSELGASSAQVIPGDTLEWRYQEGI